MPSSKSTDQQSLSAMFKPEPGSWECNDCYTRNNAESTQCVSCQASASLNASATASSPNESTISTSSYNTDSPNVSLVNSNTPTMAKASDSRNLFDKFKPVEG